MLQISLPFGSACVTQAVSMPDSHQPGFGGREDSALEVSRKKGGVCMAGLQSGFLLSNSVIVADSHE